MAADAILNILLNVSGRAGGLPKVVRSRVMAELPFMASENIMMKAVKKGGDRQELHERLREMPWPLPLWSSRRASPMI